MEHVRKNLHKKGRKRVRRPDADENSANGSPVKGPAWYVQRVGGFVLSIHQTSDVETKNVSILCNGRYKEKTLLKSESYVRLKVTKVPQDERVERNGGCEFYAVGATQNLQGRNLTRLDRVVWSIEGEETTIVQETK